MATCQLLSHSIVLMETADHKVKEERRKHEEEMLLKLCFNSRTHSASSWGFKAAQHVRKKSSCVDTAHLEYFCVRLSPTATVRSRRPHLEREIRSQPLPRGWAYLRPLSWSTQKLCPAPQHDSFYLFNSRLLRHPALACQKKEVIWDN